MSQPGQAGAYVAGSRHALRDAPGVEHLAGYESGLNRVTSRWLHPVLAPGWSFLQMAGYDPV